MNLAAKSFIDTLAQNGIKYSVKEREEDVLVTCGYNLDNTSVDVNLFIDNDNQHVALRCFGFIKVPKDKFANLLLACNKCNLGYRWVKFTIDDDYDVTAHIDAVVSPNTAGEELLELMRRMLNIVDDCYPEFMKSMWA